jgi:phosphoglucosamine mutase|uniref:Phosphoglucosamine mutase n=1 Tax=Desulfobacca acetoxidans TaxID=60893 RepID=A0A7V6A5L8_9BACT
MAETRKLFGTDGVRGVANIYPMTAEVALQLGRALAHVIKYGPGRHRIVVGKDTRLSGYLLEYAITSGICSMGVDVLLLGPMPTPGIAFITHSMRADAGVVISASHNPYQDNGIKFFKGDGYKLPDEIEAHIESLLTQREFEETRPTATDIGQAFRIDDARGRYISYLKSTFPKELELDGLKIVVDCAHGATYRVAPEVLEELGAEIIAIGVRPNGRNINRLCGATHPEGMARLVIRHHADLGIAFDGDGDRCIVVDHTGRVVDGDHILAICALDMQRRQTLKRKTVVATVMSNLGLEVALKKNGLKLMRTQVGDRYVLEAMLKGGYNLGGEQSGHLVFLNHSTTGDGILTALRLLSVMLREQKPLAELAACMEVYPQVLVNLKVKERQDLGKVPQAQKAIQAAEKRLQGRGRLLVRFSGTEPVLRVMVEGERPSEINEVAQELVQALDTCLNAGSAPC